MMFFRYISVLMLVLFISKNSISQDIHFSQYFANPVSYNPANTGFFDGSYRLGVNHKQQWPWAIDNKFINYNTSSGYADFSVLDKKMNDLDWAGVGLNFINDQAGDGTLTANKGYFSFAYHKGIDKFHKHFLSVGTTIGFVHRSINFGALYFNNQWVERVGFDISLPNNENLTKENTSYLDFGFGAQSSNKWGEKFTTGLGLSFLHLNRPQESFYGQSNKLGIRYLTHAWMQYQPNIKWRLDASAYASFQKKAKETMFGVLANYKAGESANGKESILIWGTFYRWKDALNPMFGYQYHNTRIILNYDINLSSLSKVSRSNGGFEFSLTHVGSFPKKQDFTKKVYCPKF